MVTIWENVVLGIENTSWLEWIAVVTAIAYVILASLKSIYCWVFGLLSSFIYVYLFFVSALFMESALQVFYIVVSFYGWYSWKKSALTKQDIVRWPFRKHLIILILGGIGVLLVGLFFVYVIPEQQYPFVDAFTTIFSLFATFLVAKKILENWIFWIVIDGVSVWLYAQRDLYLSSVLMICFTGMAVYGYVRWKKEFQQQRS